MTDDSQYRVKFHPVFHWISLFVGVLGIALAVVFYLKSERNRRPVFFLSQRNIILDRQLSIGDKLQFSYEGAPLRADQITAVQCYFWNAGNEPIRSNDVLAPIRIKLENGAEILNASVIKQSRPDVVRFEAVPIKDLQGKRTGLAELHFNILENNDGATIQIVYTGGPASEVTLDGTIEGAQINAVEFPLGLGETAHSSQAMVKGLVLGIPILLFFGNALIGISVFHLVPPRRPFADIRETLYTILKDKTTWVLFGLTILSLALYWYLFHNPEVPGNILQ